MPLFRRRPLLRAAAVGGGAYMLGKRRAEQEQTAYAPEEPQPAARAASGPRLTSEDTARLAELGKLHEQGVLTDEEFAHEKAVILGTA